MAETAEQRAERLARKAAAREQNRAAHRERAEQCERERASVAASVDEAVYGVSVRSGWLREQERIEATMRAAYPPVICERCGRPIVALCLPVLMERAIRERSCPECSA